MEVDSQYSLSNCFQSQTDVGQVWQTTHGTHGIHTGPAAKLCAWVLHLTHQFLFLWLSLLWCIIPFAVFSILLYSEIYILLVCTLCGFLGDSYGIKGVGLTWFCVLYLLVACFLSFFLFQSALWIILLVDKAYQHFSESCSALINLPHILKHDQVESSAVKVSVHNAALQQQPVYCTIFSLLLYLLPMIFGGKEATWLRWNG